MRVSISNKCRNPLKIRTTQRNTFDGVSVNRARKSARRNTTAPALKATFETSGTAAAEITADTRKNLVPRKNQSRRKIRPRGARRWGQPRRPYFGGCNSLLSQPIARSVFSGSSDRSQSKHWNVRGPLPPGGSAKVRGAPHMGQVGRFARPMEQFCQWSKCPSIRILN
jgi:hypothetical protein